MNVDNFAVNQGLNVGIRNFNLGSSSGGPNLKPMAIELRHIKAFCCQCNSCNQTIAKAHDGTTEERISNNSPKNTFILTIQYNNNIQELLDRKQSWKVSNGKQRHSDSKLVVGRHSF